MTVQVRERPIVVGALALLVALAWAILVLQADGLHMAAMPMPGRAALSVALATFGMWVLMMVAMMTPSAVPMILLHARIAGRAEPARARAMSGGFIAAYLAAWTGFSLAVTLVQDGLARTGVIDHTMALSHRRLGGLVMIAAGAYQCTPLKHACLAHCRGPVHFLSQRWHAGVLGAFRTGLAHALYCVGCCWMLMLLLFVGGVMNVTWIAGLTALVLAEKLAPGGPLIAKASGAVLMVWGLWLLAIG